MNRADKLILIGSVVVLAIAVGVATLLHGWNAVVAVLSDARPDIAMASALLGAIIGVGACGWMKRRLSK